MSSPLPIEVQDAYETLLRLTIQHQITFSGMMMRGGEQPLVVIVGNVKERGHQLAELFRQFADFVDQAVDAGAIGEQRISRPS